WQLTTANVILVCVKSFAAGFSAGWIAKKRGKLIGALADFFPFFCFLFFVSAVFVVTGQVLDVDVENYSDTNPVIWTYIGFVPAIIGGHIGVKRRERASLRRQTGCLNDTPELVSRNPHCARGNLLANQRTERSAERRDFNAVRQTSMDVIVWRKEMDLRLICEASKGCRESN